MGEVNQADKGRVYKIREGGRDGTSSVCIAAD